MRVLMIKVITVIGLIALFVSCDENEIILDKTRLVSYTREGSSPFIVLYNSNNQPIKIGNSITYNANNQIIEFGSFTYGYTQSKISSITDTPNSIHSFNEAQVTYNAQGKIDKEVVTFTNASTNITKTFTRDYSYDSNGYISQILEDREELGGFNSLVKYEIAYYADGKIDDIVRSRSLNNGNTYLEEEVLTHFYDDKINPFYTLLQETTQDIGHNTFLQYVGFPTISLGYSSNIKLHHYAQNNLIRVEKSVFGNSPTIIASYTYTYNQDDYPLTAIKTITQQSGSTYTEDYAWSYEDY